MSFNAHDWVTVQQLLPFIGVIVGNLIVGYSQYRRYTRRPGREAHEWDWTFIISGEGRERLYVDDGRNRIDVV